MVSKRSFVLIFLSNPQRTRGFISLETPKKSPQCTFVRRESLIKKSN